MKKIIYSIFAIAALAACNKTAAPEVVEQDTPAEVNGFVIKVSTDTKALFNEQDYSVSWKENEELHVLINNEAYTFTRVEESDYFVCDTFYPIEGTEYNWEILTPYNSSNDYGDRVFTYSGGVKVTMYGQAITYGYDSPEITMKHLTNIIKTTIKNVGETELTIKSIKIESNKQIIGGRYRITNGELTAVKAVDYTVMEQQTVKIPAGEQKDMFVQCKPFTTVADETLKFTLIDINSENFVIEKHFTEGQVSFAAGTVNNTTVEIAHVEPEPEATEAVYIDFGGHANAAPTPWNKVTAYSLASDATPIALKNTSNETSYIKISELTGFTGTYNGAGGEQEGWTLEYNEYTIHSFVWRDGLLISGTTNKGNKGPASLVLSGFDTNKTYSLDLVAVRFNGSTSARETQYVIVGAQTSDTYSIKPGADTRADWNSFISRKDSLRIQLTNIQPDANGKITIQVTAIDTKSACDGLLNALVITEEE